MDIKLTNEHDLDLTTKDLQLTNDADGESVRQRLLVRLLSFRGELITNTDYGTPYYQTIFQKGVGKDVVDATIQREIRDVDGVSRLLTFSSSLNNATREYSASFRVSTTTGAIVEIQL